MSDPAQVCVETTTATGWSFGALTNAFVLGMFAALLFTQFLKSKLAGNKDEAEAGAHGEPSLTAASRSLSLSPTNSPLKASSYAAAAGLAHSSGLLSGILAQLWSHMNVALSKTIKESVEPTFKETLPGPLSSLRFTQLDMGAVPMRMDNIIVHELKNDRVQFDVDIVWDGECCIELKADYVGSFGVQKVKLFGRMCILLAPLTNELPVVSAIQYCFINPPLLELDFTGIANLADCGLGLGVDKMIRDIIQDSLASMLVLPNRMLFRMDPSNNFMDTYQPPVGVARLTAVSGQGFHVQERTMRKNDVPDVYLNIQLGNKTWRTSTIKDCCTPEWNESADFLLCDNDQIISVHAWDEDRGKLDADDDLGSAQLTVGQVLLAGKTSTVDLLGGEQQQKGASVTLRCDVCALTTHLDSLDSLQEKNHLYGLLTIVVTRAMDLPLDKEKASSFVKITYGEQSFVTGTVAHAEGVDALNPVFDSVYHIPLVAPKLMAHKEHVEFELMNGEEDVLGATAVTHADLVAAPERTITEKRKIGDKGAVLEFRVALRGVQQPTTTSPVAPNLLSEAAPAPVPTSSSVTTTSALGTVRLTAVKGWGFQEEKRRLKKSDIPDVYCKITFGSSPTVWQTSTIKNSTTPLWNESRDYLLSDQGQMIIIKAFDEDKGSRDDDDELGSARITVGKLLLAGGATDVELQQSVGGKPTGCFISLRCDMI